MKNRYTSLVNALGIVSFLWLLIKAGIERDLTVLFPLILLIFILIYIYRSMKVKHPYIYEEEEAILEFKSPQNPQKAVYSLLGKVRSTVEGWKIFHSTHFIPQGGQIGEVGEYYEGIDTYHYKEPGSYNEWMIFRVLKTPLEKNRSYTFTHWMELINCYQESKQEFGLKIIIPVKKRLTMTLIFIANQKHSNVKLLYSRGEKVVGREFPLSLPTVLEDGRVKYTHTNNKPETEAIYYFTWNW